MTKEQCKGCHYQATEHLSGGYGMPVREKPYCILEKQNRPCEKEEDIKDIPNDSYGGNKEVGA